MLLMVIVVIDEHRDAPFRACGKVNLAYRPRVTVSTDGSRFTPCHDATFERPASL